VGNRGEGVEHGQSYSRSHIGCWPSLTQKAALPSSGAHHSADTPPTSAQGREFQPVHDKVLAQQAGLMILREPRMSININPKMTSFRCLPGRVLRFDGGGVGGTPPPADSNRCWRSRSRRARCAIERALVPALEGSGRGVRIGVGASRHR